RSPAAVGADGRLRAPGFARGGRAVWVSLGGGPPSLWEPACVARVLREVRALFEVADAPEVTLEANPEAADEPRLRAYRDAGVTRLSIGVQSFSPERLRKLGRVHTAEQAGAAFGHARAAGFQAVSVDLIHGSEGQTAGEAADDARRAAALGADHVSAYQLTLTNLAVDVPMARAVRRGLTVLPGDEEQEQIGAHVRA